MMYQIGKRFHFEAAHAILGHPKCGAIHGHSWKVEVVFSGSQLDGQGMLADFSVMKEICEPLISGFFDHTLILSEEGHKTLLPRSQDRVCILLEGEPTSENIARCVFANIQREMLRRGSVFGPRLEKVRVSETEDSWAEFSGIPDLPEVKFLEAPGC